LVLSTITGTSFGTSASEKLSFFGVTPVAQQAHITDPVGGATVDSEARAAIDAINVLLETFGFMATT